MPKINPGLAAIIPTKGRPDDLRALLNSIHAQGIWPVQIIIIDGGDLPLEGIIRDFSFFDIVHVKQKPPSTPIQKNRGLSLLKKDIQAVAFFDDDIVLCPKAIERVFEFWDNRSDGIGGLGGNILNHSRLKTSFMEKLFLLGSDKVGIVLPSGFHSRICSLDRDYQVQWLMGGATFWKRDIIKKHKFDEWYYGYSHLEDSDFSYSLSKKCKLYAIKEAKFIHNTKPILRRYEYHLGKMQVVNRVYFVKKHREFSLILCYWACTGLFLKNLFLGTLGCKPRYLLRAVGILAGILTSFIKHKQITEKIKL